MIPKVYANEGAYAAFPHYMIPPLPVIPVPFVGPIPPAFVRNDLLPAEHPFVPSQADVEAMMQVQRRKVMRRAANRRSAQLSRARKKAHLEELKAENARLQRLVDVLDSQPELVFCVTLTGKITFVSERTMNFITGADDTDEDPTRLDQILTKESASEVLTMIGKLHKVSALHHEEDYFSSPFAAKTVRFCDAMHQSITGYLRCSKVNRRTSLQELQSSEMNEKPGNLTNSNKIGQQQSSNKKPKFSHSTSTSAPDFGNFNLLVDCAEAREKQQHEDQDNSRSYKPISPVGVSYESTSSKTSQESDSVKKESNNTSENEEYVCTIRISDECFIPHKLHRDIKLFSSSFGGCVMNNNSNSNRSVPTGRPSSPSGSNNSSSINSIEMKTTSDSSDNINNAKTSQSITPSSSETLSEEDNAQY